MKVATSAFVVLASSGTALASWADWNPFGKDVTVTATATRTVQVCPCNGEVRVTQAHPASGKPTGTVAHYTVTEIIDPGWAKPRETITKAGPIVVVFSTGGSMTTKTGVKIELIPTKGPVVTKTIWTGPQPSDDLAWVDWNDDDSVGTLTRFHTKTETVFGPVPTEAQTNEPWADWLATTNTRKSTTKTSSSTSSRTNGPIGGSTTGWGKSSTTSTTSTTSSSSFGIGPGEGSTTSSSTSSSSMSMSTSSTSSFIAGPGEGTTTSSSTFSTSSSSSFVVGPGEGTTTSSSTESSTMSTTMTSTSSFTDNPIPGSTTTSSSSSPVVEVPTTSTTTTPVIIATTTTTAAAVTTTAAAGTVVIDDVRNLNYIDAILQQHNVHRRNHSAVDIVWSPSLAATANTIASSCIYAHNVAVDGGGYGQNIGAGYTPNQVGVMITNDMYNGEFSNFPGPFDTDNIDLSNFNNFGHFTQIVWKGTTQVGCATVTCPNGLVNAGFTPFFTVCNYSPPGNIRGAYSNIGAPLGGPIHVVLANAN